LLLHDQKKILMSPQGLLKGTLRWKRNFATAGSLSGDPAGT
jgi:hypothetical protein